MSFVFLRSFLTSSSHRDVGLPAGLIIIIIIIIIIGATGTVTRSLRKNLEAVPGKKFDRFTTKDSYTWNITHNTESTAM